MSSLITNKSNKYIGSGVMGFCGHACREFINNLSLKELTNWSMLNIRSTTTSNTILYLQDVRGNFTPNHVFMINTPLNRCNLNNERDLSKVISFFKVYDPLYDMEFENILYYVCFFYSKINFDQFDSSNDKNLKVGDNIIIDIQQQYDYENTYWKSASSLAFSTTGTFMCDVADMIKLSGINVIDTTNKEMKLFRKKLAIFNAPKYHKKAHTPKRKRKRARAYKRKLKI